MSFLYGFNQVIQTNSFLFFFVFFSLVIFLQSFLRENIALRKDCRLVKVYYYGTIFFPILVSTLFLSLIFSFKSNFFGFSHSFNLLIFIVILFEILCLLYINNWLSKKYPELKEKISILLFWGRISFSIVLTLFSKFLLTKEIAESKIEQIAVVLKNKVHNFEEIFVNSVDKEGFLVAEGIQNSVSNILSLSIKISELNSWDLSATFLYFSIFCPFYTVFFVLLTGNLNSLSEIYSSIKKNHEPESASYMFPGSKKVSQEIIPFSESKKLTNKPKERYFSNSKSKEDFISIVKDTKIKVIETPEDLVLNNVVHGAAKESETQSEFIENIQKGMEKIGSTLKITGKNKEGIYIKPGFKQIIDKFYVHKNNLVIKNPKDFSLSKTLEEREIVLSKIAEINKVLPNKYKFSALNAALFGREHNFGILGYNSPSYASKGEKTIVRIVFTMGNISFIYDLPYNKALKIINDSYDEVDQEKGYNLLTREIVFPQYVAAYEISKQFNWSLLHNPHKGQGDYIISDPLSEKQKLLEIKITDKELSFEKFKEKIQDEVVTMLESNIPKRPMVVAYFLVSEIKGYSLAELTDTAQKQIDEKIGLRGKVEVKILNTND